jgi:hypothetical protein
VQGYPDRLLPKNEAAAKELKKRTLTNLYNANPAWLQHAHRELDEAVAAAYGWEWPLAEDVILKQLFDLNQARAALQNAADTGKPKKAKRARSATTDSGGKLF